MASKRQRKKQAKKLGLWEGQQYRGGRSKGKKNLKHVDGGVINKHGVFISDEEAKQLVCDVNKSNRIRKKMLAVEDADNKGKKDTPNLRTMGKESVYSISRQSKSLQRFKSREDFEHYLDKQHRIHTGEYQLERARAYKRNFIESLLDVYGDDAKDIAMKVRMMKPDEYMRMVAQDEVLEISYVDSQSKVAGRLNQLRVHLGMKLKDEWDDETQG